MTDTFLEFYDGSRSTISTNDDASGDILDSQLVETVTATCTYYLGAGGALGVGRVRGDVRPTPYVPALGRQPCEGRLFNVGFGDGPCHQKSSYTEQLHQ